MPEKNHEFLKRLLSTFKIEAGEHVKAISSGLIELERVSGAKEQMEIVETMFREAHSLKGAARAVSLSAIEQICQSLESIFAGLKTKEVALTSPLFDALHKAVDALDDLLRSIGAEGMLPHNGQLVEDVRSLLQQAMQLSERQELKEVEAPFRLQPVSGTLPIGDKPLRAETVRIAVSKLNSIWLQSEELLSAKLASGERKAELRALNVELAGLRREREKGQHRKLKEPDSLELADSALPSLEAKLSTLAKSAEQDHKFLSNVVDNLLVEVKKVLMLPLSTLFEGLPKFVRDLSREQGKETELVIQGGEIEMDRRILEEMKDPLIHLIRNCIDHGIEKPAERNRKGKTTRGTITIAVSHQDSGKVEILVSDDGAGVDMAKARAAALKLRAFSPEELDRLDEQGVLSLIFQSGFSTSPIITSLSGRGLGLAIVHEKVEKLGGSVAVETEPDIGTKFRIVLPLTMAAFRGVLVRAAGHLYLIPTSRVERVTRGHQDEIKTVENRETIVLEGETVSVARLADVLELPRNRAADAAENTPIVVLGSWDKRIAFLVDEIVNEQEVLLKSLGPQLTRVRNVAGAAVLGSGKVVPVLNVPDLIQSAVKISAAPARAAIQPEELGRQRKSILVVEDSITARTLLKNILESAGYDVKVAVDGADAFTTLRTEAFDLVVSDVDMPRINGFELTKKIRADKKLAELPIVLVTALESREDRERGVDAGANAYIVKSGFDQSNLLEIIQRFV